MADGLFNLTTNDPPTQGTMAWLVSQCTSCQALNFRDPSRLNLTGIPTQEFKFPLLGAGNLTEATSLVSLLVCHPRATIETREIRADGSGRVEVVESKPLVRQGNLHIAQTKLLLSKASLQHLNKTTMLIPYTQALTKYTESSVSLLELTWVATLTFL